MTDTPDTATPDTATPDTATPDTAPLDTASADEAGTDVEAPPARDAAGRLVVDATGMPCPRPVLELAIAVREQLAVGDELVLLADDPAADVDVPVWCRMQRQLLVAQEREDALLRFVVRKLREI